MLYHQKKIGDRKLGIIGSGNVPQALSLNQVIAPAPKQDFRQIAKVPAVGYHAVLAG